MQWGLRDDVPYIAKGEFSIGIYTGNSPFDLGPPDGLKNPVLTADDVTDIPAHYVADPFMVHKDSTWYMFLEVLNAETNQGDIGLATSPDGFEWQYEQIVINEDFHLSYPYIFEQDNGYCMIVESKKSFGLGMYIADDFPTEWSFVGTLLKGVYSDPCVFNYNDKWWLLAEEKQGFLHLYYADDLMGSWSEHPESPVVRNDRNISRPGGRVLVMGDEVYRFTQDCFPDYGIEVHAFRITKLTTTEYEETPVLTDPIITASGSGWNANGMHHVDPHEIGDGKWIACIDGFRDHFLFGLKF